MGELARSRDIPGSSEHFLFGENQCVEDKKIWKGDCPFLRLCHSLWLERWQGAATLPETLRYEVEGRKAIRHSPQ